MIPVVDIFAGPGGLGEGFSAWRDSQGRQLFELAVSIEKDPMAHETLRLRAFRRCFDQAPPQAYDRVLRREATWELLKEAHPREAARAEAEARHLELGEANLGVVRSLIGGVVRRNRPWVLIGGPPCQAYSLAGRSRNKGVTDYKPERDHRQTLYIEYLQVLADHAPPVFVMENVKGLLSAELNSQRLFERIREDLRNPGAAIRREGRKSGGPNPKYSIRALVPAPQLSAEDPRGYVVRAEQFAIPQRRHRVILIGVRDDFNHADLGLMSPHGVPVTVRRALRALPPVRSGLSKEADSDQAWCERLRSIRGKPWLRQISADVRHHISLTLKRLESPIASRGEDYLPKGRGEAVLNHSTRGHIGLDLERYLFASAFAAVSDYSPVLSEFPATLLPKHRNVERALGHGMFADRFRVQVAKQPATTITSHISKDGHYYIHPDPSQCRSLTVREAARLQTFSDDYFFCGPRTSQYQQVGNAVPPRLATQIANSVATLLGV
jgi:DNA (cytosine-5)-methyltransferase 1